MCFKNNTLTTEEKFPITEWWTLTNNEFSLLLLSGNRF